MTHDQPPPLPPAPLGTPTDTDHLDVAVRLEVRARIAGALGITALALAMAAPCSCGGTVMIGGILGAGAAWSGMRSRADEPSPGGRAWATAGVICGGAAALIAVAIGLLAGAFLVAQVMGAIEVAEAVRNM